MQFLQPVMLWGLLGISIPILIHLWRGNRGKEISWAAMHWLSEKESAVVKGLKFENLLVLLLRVLMVVLLVLLLSNVFIASLGQERAKQIIHLVQPKQEIVEEYKFEITQALDKGEPVFWATKDLLPINSSNALTPVPALGYALNAAIASIPSESDSLHIYLSNSNDELGAEYFLTPITPILHLGNKAFETKSNEVIQGVDNQLFKVNEKGVFEVIRDSVNQSPRLKLKPSDLYYYLGELANSETVFIEASIRAIDEVYGISFTKVSTADSAKIIFSQDEVLAPDANKLYFNSENYSFENHINQRNFPELLSFEQSYLVRSGRLPELILNEFLDFIGVKKQTVSLSEKQVNARFLTRTEQNQQKEANIELLLLGLFILVYIIERILAAKQGI